MTNTLKHLYGLKEDMSNSNSGLSIWYNFLINKQLKEITVADVSKMIRQDVLLEFAIDKAIEFLVSDPFDGEILDGDLLAGIVNVLKLADISRNNNRKKLEDVVKIAEQSLSGFEWTNEQSKEDFENSLLKLNNLL